MGPLTVKLMGQNTALSAGKEYELACQSAGSRPPATVTWWKGGFRLDLPTKVTVSIPVWFSTRFYHTKQALITVHLIVIIT